MCMAAVFRHDALISTGNPVSACVAVSFPTAGNIICHTLIGIIVHLPPSSDLQGHSKLAVHVIRQCLTKQIEAMACLQIKESSAPIEDLACQEFTGLHRTDGPVETDHYPRLQQERKDLREIFGLAGHGRLDRAEEKVGGNEEECGRGAKTKASCAAPSFPRQKTTNVYWRLSNVNPGSYHRGTRAHGWTIWRPPAPHRPVAGNAPVGDKVASLRCVFLCGRR